MDAQCKREMSLREVANKYGKIHIAAKQFKIIENAMLRYRKIRWWNVFGRTKILDRINQVLVDIERQEAL